MASSVYDVVRWDAPQPPSSEILRRWFSREGLLPEEETLLPETHSLEVKFQKPMVRMVVKGVLQCSFPGYGVAELHSGDCLEIQDDVLHDLKVLGSEPVILLSAFRP